MFCRPHVLFRYYNIKSSSHLLSTHNVPGTLLHASHMSSHLCFTKTQEVLQMRKLRSNTCLRVSKQKTRIPAGRVHTCALGSSALSTWQPGRSRVKTKPVFSLGPPQPGGTGREDSFLLPMSRTKPWADFKLALLSYGSQPSLDLWLSSKETLEAALWFNSCDPYEINLLKAEWWYQFASVQQICTLLSTRGAHI